MPIALNTAAVHSTMYSTHARVSTLLMIVSLANAPATARKRRLDARPAAFAFEGFEQASFFTADVRAGAFVDVTLVDNIGAGVLYAENAVVVGFLHGIFQDVELLVEFAADKNVGIGDRIGVGGDGDAFWSIKCGSHSHR